MRNQCEVVIVTILLLSALMVPSVISGNEDISTSIANDIDVSKVPIGIAATGDLVGKIAFTSNRDGNDEIFVMDADGTNVVQLTDNGASDTDPDGYCQLSCPDADGDGVCDAVDNCPDDPGPAWNCGCPCPGGGVGDVVFIMDTSGSMDDEFNALCSKIETVISDLQSQGINITYKIVGITKNRRCTSDYVKKMVSNPISNHQEDWGPATQDIAEKYSWRAGATRIIIPLSDEGPDNGYPITSDDLTSITNAKASAKANDVRVSPIICSKSSGCTDAEHNTMVSLAQDLASGTGGTPFTSSDPGADLADGIRNLLGRGVCDRDGDGVPDGCDPYPDDYCRCGDHDGDGIDDCAKNCPCEPCVSIKVEVSINKNSYTPGDVFVYNVSVMNNQISKGAEKSRIAISYGLIDPTPKTFIIGTRMPDISLSDAYNFSGDFIVPDDVYSGKYLFFAAASDLETGCSGIDAEPYSIRLTRISKASIEEAWKNWLEIVEK